MVWQLVINADFIYFIGSKIPRYQELAIVKVYKKIFKHYLFE